MSKHSINLTGLTTAETSALEKKNKHELWGNSLRKLSNRFYRLQALQIILVITED